MKILAIVHRVYIGKLLKPGGLDRFFSFLREKRDYNILTIEHPLDFKGDTVLRNINKDKTTIKKRIKLPFSFFPPARLLIEFIFNIYYLISKKLFFDILICADPFNTFSGYILKKIKRSKLLIFHSADYSDQRFNSPILNFIYQSLYKFALKKADLVFAVSTRMHKKCQDLLSGNNTKKVIFFPNAPEFSKTPKRKVDKESRQTIILVGHLIEGLNYPLVLEAIADLKKDYPRILLKIAGQGDGLKTINRLKSELNLEKNISYLGPLKQDEVLDQMAKSDIGLACYTSEAAWNFYRDSMKIREYAACGLPTIADNTTSTALDAHKNGCCLLFNDKKGLKSGISLLLGNKGFYNEMSKKALTWAKKNDSKLIYENVLSLILNKLNK